MVCEQSKLTLGEETAPVCGGSIITILPSTRVNIRWPDTQGAGSPSITGEGGYRRGRSFLAFRFVRGFELGETFPSSSSALDLLGMQPIPSLESNINDLYPFCNLTGNNSLRKNDLIDLEVRRKIKSGTKSVTKGPSSQNVFIGCSKRCEGLTDG